MVKPFTVIVISRKRKVHQAPTWRSYAYLVALAYHDFVREPKCSASTDMTLKKSARFSGDGWRPSATSIGMHNKMQKLQNY